MAHQQAETRTWIQKRPAVCGGDACVRETRVTVSGLVQWRQLGLGDDQILQQHPDLTQHDLDAAWRYYEINTAEIDKAIKDDEDA